MKNLTIVINGLEYVQKDNENSHLSEIARLEDTIAELEEENGKLYFKFNDLHDQYEDLQHDLEMANETIRKIKQLALSQF